MSEKRSRSYQKQRYRRRGEDPPRGGDPHNHHHHHPKESSLKPTSILSKPKSHVEEMNPEFPTLLQANAASAKKPSSALPPPPPSPQAPSTPAAPIKVSSEPPVPEKKKDPLEALDFPPVPETRCRLVDAKVGFHESGGLLDYLSDTNNEFLVVGIIGSKGSGKSTVLNGLIGSYIFRESDHHIELHGEDCTQGIDAWINEERVIFLDAQPTLNGSFIKDRLSSSHQGKYFSLLNCYLKKENLGEKESLLMTLFLMNICHCLIFVQDYILDPEVLHFLQLAEMLKPSSQTFDGDNNKIEYYPNLILVHNKLRTGEATPKFFRTLSEFYDSVFAQSSFQVYGGISASLHSNFKLESNSEDSEDAYEEFSMPPDLLKKKKDKPPDPPVINLYTLTDKNHDKETFKDLMDFFSRLLLSSKPRPLTTKTLTEKSWFSFAAQAWQNTCSAITSFNYEFNLAAGSGGSGGDSQYELREYVPTLVYGANKYNNTSFSNNAN